MLFVSMVTAEINSAPYQPPISLSLSGLSHGAASDFRRAYLEPVCVCVCVLHYARPITAVQSQ